MANKVEILITNSDGKHFCLTNSKMAIMMARDSHTNWDEVFTTPIGPYDVIISDFNNPKSVGFGMGYYLVEKCDTKDEAEKIIKTCREKLKSQYERMMMIRVARKYSLDPITLAKIEMEYHNPDNYEIKLKKWGDKNNGVRKSKGNY